MTTVTLHPTVVFSGNKVPDDTAVEALHHAAHEQCFLANSVKSEIMARGTWTHPAV